MYVCLHDIDALDLVLMCTIVNVPACFGYVFIFVVVVVVMMMMMMCIHTCALVFFE